jgi:hypothetical protein
VNDQPERLPYSMRKRQRQLDHRLPQDRSADQDINAAVDDEVARELSDHPVNLGFARMKGHRK